MHYARSNGHRIAYQVAGSGGSPVVLHPGMFEDGGHWAHLGYTGVLAASHTVIAVDPLGLGASDAPHEPEAYAAERRAESVTAVLDDLGLDRAAFWGYSLGAMTGYAVAAYAPERLTRLVAGGFDPDGFRSRVPAVLAALGLPGDHDVYELVKQGALGHPYQVAVIEAGDPAAYRANYDRFSREPGLGPRLAASGVPVLMYAGTADPWHDPMRDHALAHGARFFSVPDSDHGQAPRRSRQVLARVLPFLEECRAA
ncbi:alpha/beta hydrolase [Nonomuraea rubra]|uniref:Pimeloyl-ACP methyl ester carboxylesterase n=2 Tax=Nonomuraea rubra TaxID=46180 RepID=A0A7X0U056_9ACTN|nr:alpha/beta hydrolase [Nonomuraea rubra]MBB6549960.1 pimeloyl-ACP methyl ester carboxylesterase [Nonomuraea rubra]